MIRLLKLLMPALMPSWAFFKAVEASPRIEWRPVRVDAACARDWEPLWSRPETVSVAALIKRLIWNPQWNESLFITSLSERFTLTPNDENLMLLCARIKKRLGQVNAPAAAAEFEFRLVFVYRDGAAIKREVTYQHIIRPDASRSE